MRLNSGSLEGLLDSAKKRAYFTHFSRTRRKLFPMVSAEHPLISDITLLKKKRWYAYRNLLPAIPFYVIAIASFWKVETLGACVILGSVFFVHVLSFFLCIWSLRYRIHVRYTRVFGFLFVELTRFQTWTKRTLFMLSPPRTVATPPSVLCDCPQMMCVSSRLMIVRTACITGSTSRSFDSCRDKAERTLSSVCSISPIMRNTHSI